MQTRRANMEKEQERWRELGTQQVAQLKRRIKDLENELVQIDREMRLQQTRIKAARDEADRYKSLFAEKFVSDAGYKQKLNEVTDQEIKLQALRRQRSVVERDLSAAKLDEPAMELKTQTQIEQVARQISELQEGMARAEGAQRNDHSRADRRRRLEHRGDPWPIDRRDSPFATVLPKGSGLHVELLVPTRAVGFVVKGQEVVLRYEAFPFRAFWTVSRQHHRHRTQRLDDR
jgi:membrane fusion protein